jgi:hypothetical protein
MDHLRAARLKVAAEEVLPAVRGRSQQFERLALQLDEPGQPLFGRRAAAQPACKAGARFDRR